MSLVVLLKLLLSAQAKRIAELERQIATDSHNSSKPPSSDGLDKKPAPKSLCRPSGRGPGQGRSRRTTGAGRDPDQVVDHHPVVCGGCGTGLDSAHSAGYGTGHVFDLPEIRPEMTEHRLRQRACGFGHTTTATAPGQISAAKG